MADSTPTRKSARSRVPNKKYSVDAFKILDIVDLDSEGTSDPVLEIDDLDQDEDFESEAAAEDVGAEEGSLISSEEGSDGSGIATPNKAPEDDLSYASEPDKYDSEANSKALPFSSFVKKPHPLKLRKPEKDTHYRGLGLPENHGSKDAIMRSLVGTEPGAVIDFIRARDKWINDPLLPTRKCNTRGKGGMGFPFNYSEQSRRIESTTGWVWYYEQGGRELMDDAQRTLVLDHAIGSKYLPRAHKKSSFLMGRYPEQQMHTLALQESLSIREVWTRKSVETNAVPIKAASKRRNGWILNVGTKVRCLDWAPNHPDDTQYLSVAVTHAVPISHVTPSPFEPEEPYSASLQIWVIQASVETQSEETVDMEQAPQLRQVICTEWGAPKDMRWCPIARQARESRDEDKIFIGLLACVWSDGFIRVLDIRLDQSGDLSPAFVLYQSCSFESKPPDTVCTSLAWLSGTQLAAGCANGFAAIWDIAESIQLRKKPPSAGPAVLQPPSTTPLPDRTQYPHFYHHLHSSYILSVTSAYPTHSHFLVSTSVDGYIRLTDIRNPTVDFSLAPRSRLMLSPVDYFPHLQSFLNPDDNDFLRVIPIRRFFAVTGCARSEGQVLSVAAGKVHASVLIGSADGSVLVMNPMRKMLHAKETQYQQIWFKHEWVRKVPRVSQHTEKSVSTGGSTVLNSPDRETEPREGISRITEGYKVDSLDLLKRGKGQSKLKDANIFATIYEEESGVTAVAWNPNLHYGGWAAAGMGDGLIRVEDLAL